LNQETFDKIYPKISVELSKEIRTLMDTDREIFCIINEYMVPSPPTTGFRGYTAPPSTNYDWLPAKVSVAIEKSGTSITVVDKRFEKYFENVKQWVFILDLYREPPILAAFQQTTGQLFAQVLGETAKLLRYQFLPIAQNKSKKIIAGTLAYQGRKGNEGGIHLIPPPTKCTIAEAIEIILDIIHGQPSQSYPVWRSEIDVPGMKILMTKMDDELKGIKKIQERISSLQNEVQRLDVYRDMLSSTGHDLERVVQMTLLDLGIPTEPTEEGFPADLIGKDVAVEVTGIKGALNVGSEKVNQTARFRESYRKNEKLIVIANTHAHIAPPERECKTDFTKEVTEYFKAIDVCCVTSKTLLELWKDVRMTRRNPGDISKTLLLAKGELTLGDFKTSKEKR
jgi:hypothetical protein